MQRTVNWLARTLGFVWVGLFTFVIAPPHGSLAMAVQIAGSALATAGMVGWFLSDLAGAADRYRAWLLPAALGALAIGAGFASSAGHGGTALAIFTFVAAMMAGADLDLGAALAVTAAGILAIDVSGLIFGASYGVLIGFPAFVVGGVVVGRNRFGYRIRAEQAAALLAQREQLETEQRRADLLDERARIAREIHDVLAHSLGALGIQIQAARAVMTRDGDIDRAGELLGVAQQMAAEGLEETRRAVHALRADTRPLGDELARATSTYAQRYGVAVSFDSTGVPVPLPPDATIALLRVAQEALVNATKHAAGQRVAMCLAYEDAEVRLTVSNDLAPGSTGAGEASVNTVNGGYGLTGMRERLRLLNGTLEAGRRDGQWIVTAEVPRPEPAPPEHPAQPGQSAHPEQSAQLPRSAPPGQAQRVAS
jgi:signal transduction histidine kinase